MATVDKNFKVKHGLIVEGTTATVNGEDIITTGNTTDDIAEGSANLYFTAQRAADAVADEIATAVSTAVDALTTTDVAEGTNLYFTDARALTATASAYDAAGAADAAELAANGYTDGEITTALTTAQGYADAAETAANSYTDTAVSTEATDRGIAITNAINTEVTDRDAAIDVAINNEVTARDNAITTALTTAQGYADSAESDANAYTDTALQGYTPTSGLDAAVDGLGYLKSADLSGLATETFVGTAVETAVDALVDGAPGLLDTLNEIAAAINDDANYATTMTTALAGKQATLTAGSNIDITDDVIAVVGLTTANVSEDAVLGNLYFTTQRAIDAGDGVFDGFGAAATAEQNAKDYADDVALTAENNAKGYADATFVTPSSLSTSLGSYVASTEKGSTGGVATLDNTGNVPLDQLGNVPDAYITSVGANLDVTANELTISTTPDFTAVSISDIAKQVAAEVSAFGTLPATIYSFSHEAYRAGEFLIKISSGTHTEISKVLLTLDTSNNIAITEYGTVGTNGTMATLTAVINGANVDLKATPVNDSQINLVGTLLN